MAKDTPHLKYRNIALSGIIATGTSTLAHNLVNVLGWEHVNIGALQREFDRKNKIHEHKHGAIARSDEHEQAIEAMTKEKLTKENNLIYEAWLAGFVARDISGVLKVLTICSSEDIRVDRIVNRENISVAEAKAWLKQREKENVNKWKKLYGDYDFWDPEYFDLVIDTYSSGPIQTLGKVLDKLGYKGELNGK